MSVASYLDSLQVVLMLLFLKLMFQMDMEHMRSGPLDVDTGQLRMPDNQRYPGSIQMDSLLRDETNGKESYN